QPLQLEPAQLFFGKGWVHDDVGIEIKPAVEVPYQGRQADGGRFKLARSGKGGADFGELAGYLQSVAGLGALVEQAGGDRSQTFLALGRGDLAGLDDQ